MGLSLYECSHRIKPLCVSHAGRDHRSPDGLRGACPPVLCPGLPLHLGSPTRSHVSACVVFWERLSWLVPQTEMESLVTLSLFPVTVTKHHELSHLCNRKLLSLGLEPKSRMKVLAGWSLQRP